MGNRNSLVSFLRHYGPIAAADNMYDELIQAEIERHKIEPAIHIPLAVLDVLLENFKGQNPRSVILTGTAGDGKTYHCRQVWLRLRGCPTLWNKGEKIITLTIPSSQKKLTIVKDLSELTQKEKDKLLTEVALAIRGIDPNKVFLIAANDGQLLASLREWSSIKSEKEENIFSAIENMIVDDQESSNDYLLDIFNLSRLDASKHFEELVCKVVNHRQWEQCSNCSLISIDGKSKCPIRINRELLKKNKEGKNSIFVERLSNLIKIASANRMHVPIRDLLLLVVNILLGDQKGTQRLLTCRTARRRYEEEEYHLTNPYANVFGANLPMRLRQQYQVFNVLESFDIGRQTDNIFDDLLIYGPYRKCNDYKKHIASDEFYGTSAYKYYLDDYLDGEREELSNFLIALSRQRQRLFFSFPANDMYNPWRLCIYQTSGLFLDFLEAIKNNSEIGDIQKLIIKGLNRTFTGMMIDDDNTLYLTTSGGDSRGRLAFFLNHEISSVQRDRRTPYLSFSITPDNKAPKLKIIDPSEELEIASFILRPTHFEYLIRVAKGSLPNSFSQQFNEDFLDFKLTVIKKMNDLLQPNLNEEKIELIIITINEQGSVSSRPLEINKVS